MDLTRGIRKYQWRDRFGGGGGVTLIFRKPVHLEAKVVRVVDDYMSFVVLWR